MVSGGQVAASRPVRESFSAVIPGELAEVAGVRRLLEQRLTKWGCPEVDAVVLAVHELVANAVRHGCASTGDVVRLAAHYAEGLLLVTVADPSPAPPVPRPAGDGAVDGRGLALVEALTDCWGYGPSPEGPGKQVWCLISGAVPLP